MSENNNQDYSNLIELAGLSDFITSYGSGASLTDIKLADLYKYLQNPYSNIKEIQKASRYLTNKHGIIKDVLRTLKSLPSLNYRLHWSSYDDVKKIEKYEKKIQSFLSTINVKQVLRDGLFEVGELGTLVICNRSNKYIQFLDIDDLRINRQRNGKWVVEYDLNTINGFKNTNDKLSIIESLPDEVTVAKYNLYRSKGDNYRYVELENTDVVSIDGNRNFPYGLPFTIGAWSALLQKEIIDKVERSVADRLLKTIVILSAGHLDKAGEKPVPKEVIQAYFKEVSNLFQKKDGYKNGKGSDSSGTGTIALPHFLKLETLDVDTELFKKELYDKIEKDIYSNLGVSTSLIYGGGDGFSSAQLNSEKIYRYIFTIIERFEIIINSYIKSQLPNGLDCELLFDRSTISDKDKMVANYKEFYLQTNILQPYAESVLGVDYKYAISQAEYENKVLHKQKSIYPAQNAFTQSGNDNKGGRPESDGTNENTNKSKSNGGNDVPRPSTT